MKILMLCNIMLPCISRSLNQPINNFGGWLSGITARLLETENIELTVVFPHKEVIEGNVDNLKYYSFIPESELKYSKNNEIRFKKIISYVNPDIVHIYGTEYPHTLAMVKAFDNYEKTVINIQGLCSSYEKHYYAFLPSQVIEFPTFRDIIRNSNLKKDKEKFIQKGKLEIEALRNVKNIVGRTDWDKACSLQINPNADYYLCNENLRDVFYNNEWDLEKCEQHSIFISQCSYPIKGFHLAIEAVAEVKKQFPDVKIYTTGNDIRKLPFYKRSSYVKYLMKLMNKYDLNDNVCFCGYLSEQEMCDRFLKSNVFAMCSSIENSPNSLGEAMLLGVPCVASDVGGVKNMLTHKEEGFVYQADAPYMLAHYIMEVFKNRDLTLQFSENSKKHAALTHDRDKNCRDVLNVYNSILNR